MQMSPPIQYRGTSTVRCEGKMTLNKNKRLVAKEQQVIASDSSLPCKVFFSSRTERKEQRRSVKKKIDWNDGKKNVSVGPLDRERENLPSVSLAESTLQFAAKTKKGATKVA